MYTMYAIWQYNSTCTCTFVIVYIVYTAGIVCVYMLQLPANTLQLVIASLCQFVLMLPVYFHNNDKNCI